MKWLTEDLKERLLENGRRKAECDKKNEACDLVPLIYLTFSGGSEWLIACLSADDPDIAFGLCQTAWGMPELGNVRLSQLDEMKDERGRGIREDASFKEADRISLSEYVQLAEEHKAIALRYTNAANGSVKTVAASVRDGLAGTFLIMADPTAIADSTARLDRERKRVEAESQKLPAPRIFKRLMVDTRRFERVIVPGYKMRGEQHPSVVSDFEVCVEVGKEITIRKDGDDREQKFVIGDQAAYAPYWNYRTHGKILAITAKTVRIADHGDRTARQAFHEFARCNFGFDQRETYKKDHGIY